MVLNLSKVGKNSTKWFWEGQFDLIFWKKRWRTKLRNGKGGGLKKRCIKLKSNTDFVFYYTIYFKYVYDNSDRFHHSHLLLPQLRSHLWVISCVNTLNVKSASNLALASSPSHIIPINNINYSVSIWITMLQWIVLPWHKSSLFGITKNRLKLLVFPNLQNGRGLFISLVLLTIPWITDTRYQHKAKLRYFSQLMMTLSRIVKN